MKLRLKSVAAGATALALAGAGLALAAPANAYTGTGAGGAPVWAAGDTARKGAVLFYDANGAQITGGANINAAGTVAGAFGYLATSGGTVGAGATRVNAFVAAPDPANAVTSTWAVNNVTPLNYNFSTATGIPASVSGHSPFIKLNVGGASLQDVASGLVLYTGANAEYKNVLEIRVIDNVDTSKYWASDIEYNPTSATAAYDGLAPGEWRVVYPAVASTATSVSAVSSTAGVSYNVGTATDLSATVSPAGVSGSVVFKDGATTLGTVANPASGAATLTGITLGGSGTPGTPLSHSITAQFVPTAFTPVSGSTSAALSIAVNTPAQNTVTSLVLSGLTTGAVTQPNAVTATASVTWGSSASVGSVGTVQFVVDGVNFGSPVAVTSGVAVLNISSGGLTVAAHTVFAHYSDGSQFNPSDSSTSNFSVTAPAFTPDVQAIETAINPGTITISTPYDGNATKASYCLVDLNTTAAHVATFGKVVWTAAAVTAAIPGAVEGDALPVWSGTTQQNTTACGFLFVPAMTLNGTASLYSTSATFDGISVTDTRPGTNSYTLNALASDLSKQGVTAGADEIINAQNIGLTGLAVTSSNMLAPYNTFIGGQVPGTPGTPGVGAVSGQNFTGYDNAAAAGLASNASGAAGLGGGAGHQILHANRGLGTITTAGTVAINAPTNTRDGVYAGTITFTVLGS